MGCWWVFGKEEGKVGFIIGVGFFVYWDIKVLYNWVEGGGGGFCDGGFVGKDLGIGGFWEIGWLIVCVMFGGILVLIL